MADENFDPYYTWLGIRPEEQPPDHYRLVGLRQFEENADVIANAIDQKMQFLRTLQVGKRSAQSQKLLNEISTAGGCLLDPERKAAYDKELKAKEAVKAQATKVAAAKTRPLPKAASLTPIPKPAQGPGLEPLPQSDIFGMQVPTGPATPSHTAPLVASRKAAPGFDLKSPAIIAAIGGGVLVLLVVVAAAGWMFSRGGKTIAAITPPAKAPANTSSTTIPAPVPRAGSDKTEAEKQPVELPKEAPGTELPVPPTEVPVVQTSEPPRSDWQPPTPSSSAAFRTMLGTYMYSLERAKTYPIVNLQVPRKNLWTPEIQERVGGQVPYDEISYVGTAKIVVPTDGMYVLDTEKAARVQIDGQVVADWDTPKGELRIAGGIHDFTFEIGSHGGNWMRETILAIRHKETGEEVPFFNTWQDIQKFLATPVNGQSVTEVSGWQPTEENELKNYAQLLASAGVSQREVPVVAAGSTLPAPVHSWGFDEKSGDTVADSGKGDAKGKSPMRLTGWGGDEPTFVPGRIGNALRFSQPPHYAATDRFTDYPQLSVVFWLRVLEEQGINPRIASPWVDLNLEKRSGVGVLGMVVEPQKPEPGKWHHYAVTVDQPTRQAAIYRDGVQVASGPLGDYESRQNVKYWAFGHNQDQSNASDTLRGELDELKIYDRILSATEVRQLASFELAKATGAAPPEAVASDAAAPVVKVAVPDAAAIEKARKQLVEVFGDEGRGASTPEKKLELAKKMLSVETESKNDSALQYVLLDNARKLLVAAGEAELALATADKLGGQFELDPWTLKAETATALSDLNVLPAVRDQIAARLLRGTSEALSAQKFAAAEDFARLAAKVSAKGKDIELRKTITQKRADLARLKQHFAKVEEARAKLAASPDDAEANQIVGKFVALGLVDFDAGIPYLAKGGQNLYVVAATADLRAVNAEKGARLAAADAWYALAESLKAEDKAASTTALRRARDWYDTAAAEIQGLEKVRIERRLKELQGLATTNPRKAYTKWRTTRDGFPLIEGLWNESTIPVVITQNEGDFSATCEYQHPTDGQIRWQAEGKISKDGQVSITLRHVQAPQSWTKLQTRNGQLNRDGETIQGDATFPGGKHRFTWKLVGQTPVAQAEPRPGRSTGRSKAISGMVGRGYADGKDINLFFTYHPGHKLTRDEIQELQNNLGKGDVRVDFLGTLSLSADTEVAFHHLGGSSSGGVNYLFLDGKEIHAVGDDRTKDDTLTMNLGKGDHLVRWVVTGGNLGDALLEVNVAKSSRNPSARLELHAPAEMVAAARAPGVRREFEYGVSPQAFPAEPKAMPKGIEKRGRNTARRPVARPGRFDAVVVTPGGVHGSGKEVVSGWEFKLKDTLLVTELGIYDDRQNGLGEAHEVAIWDLENEQDPVVQATVPAGEAAALAGMFRCVSVDRVELKAGRRYAIVAHFANAVDSSVSLLNPDGLTIDYAPTIEVLGRRHAFPQKAMAFPTGSAEGARNADIGPTFRFDVVPEKKE